MVHILPSKLSRAGRTGAAAGGGIPHLQWRCSGGQQRTDRPSAGSIKLQPDLSDGSVNGNILKISFGKNRSSSAATCLVRLLRPAAGQHGRLGNRAELGNLRFRPRPRHSHRVLILPDARRYPVRRGPAGRGYSSLRQMDFLRVVSAVHRCLTLLETRTGVVLCMVLTANGWAWSNIMRDTVHGVRSFTVRVKPDLNLILQNIPGSALADVELPRRRSNPAPVGCRRRWTTMLTSSTSTCCGTPTSPAARRRACTG